MFKKFFALALILALSTPAYAGTLYEFYGGHLPSVEKRAESYNIFFSDTYRGTAEQNSRFLGVLTDPAVGATIDESSFSLGAITAVADYRSSLSSGITAVATTLTVAATSTPSGEYLTQGRQYGLKLGGREYVLGTLSSGRQFTSLTRGVSLITGTSTGGVAEAWGRGTSVELTDAPILLEIANKLNGSQRIDALLRYDDTILITSASATTTLASKYYVDNVVTAGCADATSAVRGCVELASGLEAASTTSIGGTGASLVLPSSFATSSPYTPGNYVPITNARGVLSPLFIATTTQDVPNGYTFASTTSTIGNIGTAGINTLNAGSTNTSSTTIGFAGGQFVGPRFYGTGSDGALALTSGTTTISAGGQRVLELDYTSVSITGTGHLAFSNPNTNGTVVIIKSQGACTLTTSGVSIYTAGMGAAGGAIGTAGRAATATNIGNRGNGPGGGLSGLTIAGATVHGAGGGGGGSGTIGTVGAGGSASTVGGFGGNSTMAVASTTLYAEAGGGGASGSDATETSGVSSAGAAGGIGGGGLVLACGGALNNTSIISTMGTIGSNSDNTTADGGGGGGGAGGNVLILYTSFTADSGTYSTAGGAGGSGNAGGSGGAGATGATLRARNTNFN